MPPVRKVLDLTLPLEACPAVHAEDTLKEAVAVLRAGATKGETALLVVGEEGQPVGILTLELLLQAFEPDFVETSTWKLPVFWNTFFDDKCREQVRRKVRDVMQPLECVATVEARDPLPKALHVMVTSGLPLLPVAKDGRIIGVLRINELFEAIGKAIG